MIWNGLTLPDKPYYQDARSKVAVNALTNSHWIPVLDGDCRAVALYEKHYSARKGDIDRVRYGFSGEGESLILITEDCKALFGWRKQKIEFAGDGQRGVCCFVFRREGGVLASELIKDAIQWAYDKWGKQRLYTYIDVKKIRHKRDPGRCFLKAGFRDTGKVSKKGLRILELSDRRGVTTSMSFFGSQPQSVEEDRV